MTDTPEMKALLAAVNKIDKKVEWREARIEQDRKDIARMLAERDVLAGRYRDLNVARNDLDDDNDEDPWA